MSSFLDNRLDIIREKGTFRSLPGTVTGTDFWSNDYLGLARRPATNTGPTHSINGSTGSRLISGDRDAFHSLEARIAGYHGFESALLFPSGYTAFLGLLSAILKRTDTIIYDELSHACCRDGIRLGHARALRYQHNDVADLSRQLSAVKPGGEVFVLTESRFSMDGDVAPLAEIAEICTASGSHLIVDEAHSGGLDGDGGRGMVHELGLTASVFASVITYGKAFGAHGAAVLGPQTLREYLINTARPFIYSTAPAAAQYATIDKSYDALESEHSQRLRAFRDVTRYFEKQVSAVGLEKLASVNQGPIQVIMAPGNDVVMRLEKELFAENLLVKAIRSPTVAAGRERLRICLHAFNTREEIDRLLAVLRRELATFVTESE